MGGSKRKGDEGERLNSTQAPLRVQGKGEEVE